MSQSLQGRDTAVQKLFYYNVCNHLLLAGNTDFNLVFPGTCQLEAVIGCSIVVYSTS